MANNCLVTELKAVVDNDNLPIFDGFMIPLVQQDWIFITRFGGYDAQHPVIGYTKNCEMYNSDKSIHYPNPNEFVSNYGFYVGDMQTNPRFYAKNITNLGYFTFINLNGSLEPTGKTPEGWFLDCSILRNCINLKELTLQSCTIKAKTSDFVNMTSLTFLALPSDETMTNVDLVDLVKAWITNGRSSSGNISGTFETGCKFNGTELYNYHAYTNRTLTWESASKIWLPAGNKILCVGYSDGEIATKTAAGGEWEGKTAVKCD
jgi:hypothetical protein